MRDLFNFRVLYESRLIFCPQITRVDLWFPSHLLTESAKFAWKTNIHLSLWKSNSTLSLVINIKSQKWSEAEEVFFFWNYLIGQTRSRNLSGFAGAAAWWVIRRLDPPGIGSFFHFGSIRWPQLSEQPLEGKRGNTLYVHRRLETDP